MSRTPLPKPPPARLRRRGIVHRSRWGVTKAGGLLGALVLLMTAVMVGFAGLPAYASAYTSCVYAAHRGDHTHATENSLNAMKAAVRDRANYLEMDVQVTTDGRFYLMHDQTVTRTTNGRGRIQDKTSQQVDRLRLNDGEHVPRLGSVLNMARPTRVQVMLEMKWIPQSRYPALESKIEGFGVARVILHSFSSSSVRRFRHMYPETLIRTGIDVSRPISVDTAKSYGGVLPDYRIASDHWLRALQVAGVPSYVWTVDNVATWKREQGLTSAIITNRPLTFDAYRSQDC